MLLLTSLVLGEVQFHLSMLLLTSLVLGEVQFHPCVDEVLDDINDLIHLCLLHACVPSKSNLTSNKSTTPFGQLPLLQWGDEVICQSMACARFVAREVGLAGNTSLEQAQVDEIIDVIQDLINAE